MSRAEETKSKDPEVVEMLLTKAAELTEMMRQHQTAVQRIGEHRRVVIRTLREHGCPYRSIASACGVTDQALYADLRKHPE